MIWFDDENIWTQNIKSDRLKGKEIRAVDSWCEPLLGPVEIEAIQVRISLKAQKRGLILPLFVAREKLSKRMHASRIGTYRPGHQLTGVLKPKGWSMTF